ncbi:rhamnulose-1-phosphate aldolase [Lacticaseibacillus daqingensis]|uniref:rhamnulose-1-phosphate aldolase n=1 Tax=Lacticaseibacillus daqingensis TaxID=2486014 RepID=UPI001CDCF005|nr:rhamnulose-1-phosphate aldolase [Lacticaseibacillus daqingensis]
MTPCSFDPEFDRQFVTSPYVRQLQQVTQNLYRHGWDERNGGNVSILLHPEEVAGFADVAATGRQVPLGFDAQALAGQYFLVTGTGRYFKNVQDFPARDAGLVRISATGTTGEIVWGFTDGGFPTSELPTHLMTHAQRLQQDPTHRVVMHCHPTNLIAMSFTVPLDECTLTRILWKMQAESLVVFPEGVGVLPYMTPGTNAIGEATAAKMATFRLVLWAQHGLFGTGCSVDEAFGLIETAEKAAQIYTTICAQGGRCLAEITDRELQALATRFGITPDPRFMVGAALQQLPLA